MPTLLAADVGGTKTILQLANFSSPIKLQSKSPPIDVLYEQTYISQDFSDLVPMAETFFAEAKSHLGKMPPLQVACFGIAGPVVDNHSELTNLKWQQFQIPTNGQ